MIGSYGKFYTFSFPTPALLLEILHGGPYAVDGALLSLCRWEPGLSFEHIRVTKILMWVQLKGLPIEYFNPIGGKAAAEMIGEVQEVRISREDYRNMGYLRAKVWINPHSPLIPGFYLTLKTGRLIWIACTYETLHKFCRKCGRIGHSSNGCEIGTKTELEVYLNMEFQRLFDRRNLPYWKDPNKELFPRSLKGHGHRGDAERRSFIADLFVGQKDISDPKILERCPNDFQYLWPSEIISRLDPIS